MRDKISPHYRQPLLKLTSLSRLEHRLSSLFLSYLIVVKVPFETPGCVIKEAGDVGDGGFVSFSLWSK